MNQSKLKIRAMRDELWGDTIELLLWHDRDGKIAVAQPVEFKEITDEERAYRHNRTLTMSKDAAQCLIDELWSVGLRPTEGTGSAGSLAATERHLADMRAIVFKEVPPGKVAASGPCGDH